MSSFGSTPSWDGDDGEWNVCPFLNGILPFDERRHVAASMGGEEEDKLSKVGSEFLKTRQRGWARSDGMLSGQPSSHRVYDSRTLIE